MNLVYYGGRFQILNNILKKGNKKDRLTFPKYIQVC